MEEIKKSLPEGYVIVDYEKIKDYFKDADGTFGESPITGLVKYVIEGFQI